MLIKKNMKYDVYDIDERKWCCWNSGNGFLCEWMPEKEYLRWYYIEYGAIGRKLPSTRTIYRSQAEDLERERRHATKDS